MENNANTALTPSMIKYLTTIQQLAERFSYVRTVDIAGDLSCMGSEVSETIEYLSAMGMVAYSETGHIILTSKGAAALSEAQNTLSKVPDEVLCPLSETQIKCLTVIHDLLKRFDNVYHFDLADYLNCSNAAVSGMLKKLDSLGYIRYDHHGLHLTELGKAYFNTEETISSSAESNTAAAEDITPSGNAAVDTTEEPQSPDSVNTGITEDRQYVVLDQEGVHLSAAGEALFESEENVDTPFNDTVTETDNCSLTGETAEACLGKLMVELHAKTRKELADCEDPFDGNENYNKILYFGSEDMFFELQKWNEKARKAGAYREALHLAEEGDSQSLKQAVTLIQSISGWKDTDAKAKEFSRRYETVLTEER